MRYKFNLWLLASVLIFTGFVLDHTDGKVFTRCKLAKELLNQGFQRTFVSNWVCLVESESDRDTTKVIRKSDGSAGYGVFQIHSKKYCKEGKKGGTCNIACESLLIDDITAASNCAKTIFAQDGFKAWPGWIKKCKGNSNLPDINNCPGLETAGRNSPETSRQRRTWHSILNPHGNGRGIRI